VSPGFDASEPCPPCIECIDSVVAGFGGPIIPISRFFVTTKWRVTFIERVSISTSMSSIMQAEYCLDPCELRREPCGMVQVCIRATSVIVPVETTETDDGTMSP